MKGINCILLFCILIISTKLKAQNAIFLSEGKIEFSVFGQQKLCVTKNNETEIILFKPLQHVQQPMIEEVVNYFLDEGPNPCSAHDGAEVMRLIDQFTEKE